MSNEKGQKKVIKIKSILQYVLRKKNCEITEIVLAVKELANVILRV